MQGPRGPAETGKETTSDSCTERSRTMNTKAILALAAFAALAATGARADDADASQYAVQFTGNRTRAEVQAEAAQVAQTRSIEPAGSRVIAAPQSSREQR